MLGVVNSAVRGGFPLQTSLTVSAKHGLYCVIYNEWGPVVTDGEAIDLGVRCQHVLLESRVVVWSERWNHLRVERGVVVVGHLTEDGLSSMAVFAPGEWRQVYEAWSRGDHEIEADAEGVF